MNSLKLKIALKRDPSRTLVQTVYANSFLSRLVGLLNHGSLPVGEGMLLEPCNQVHTFFMRFGIDAVFLSADNRVLGWQSLRPWRLSKMYFRGRKVLELPFGTCAEWQLRKDDEMEISHA